MRVLVDYDLECDDQKLTIRDVDVHTIMEIPSHVNEDQISDWISDRTGWCVLRWEKIVPLRRGDLVLIKSDKYTQPTYGANDDMRKQIGTVQKVKEADEYSVHAGAGYWKRQDIQRISSGKKIDIEQEPVLFDVKELDV